MTELNRRGGGAFCSRFHYRGIRDPVQNRVNHAFDARERLPFTKDFLSFTYRKILRIYLIISLNASAPFIHSSKMAGLAEGQESSSDRCSSPSLSVSVLDSQEALNESKATTEEDEGGWSYKFVDVVDKEFECIICLLPLKNPFMTRCGHGMCKTCLDKLLEKLVTNTQ